MKLLSKGLFRGLIPLVLLFIISLWNRLQGQVEESNVFFFYGVIAFFLGLSSVIYEIPQWTFSKQILAHYGVMLFTVFPTILLSGFYPLNSVTNFVKVFIEFNMVGIILFIATYFASKLIRKFNHVKTE
ncbi:DUF3021 family protein [Alkalibacillus sp. S2W]|uniref:Membrane channel-forming protein YqfA (Hemolysin III family) n=1 Tax=Alkalibacillus flavidus TaxID=546021 RepID=A0ABV2KUD2_9BACI